MLVVLALIVRWLSSGGPVLGDESWYFYLARTLGSEPAAEVDHAWFHLLNRPLFYAIYHLGAFDGFALFRGFGSVVGALNVAAVFVVARVLGAARHSAFAVSCVLCVQRPLVEYGAHGFPDPLASVFALATIWTAVSQRAAFTCLLATCSVLSKESFLVVPLIATIVRLSSGTSRPDGWAWATVVLPMAYVATVTVFGSGTQGIALQGWATTLMSWKHARGMWVGPELWPLLAWCLILRRWQWLTIWLGLPAFYVLWSFGLGRGVAPWYVIGPASLGAVGASLALTDVQTAVLQRFPSLQAHLLRVVLAGCLVPVAWSGILRTGSQVLTLRHGLPQVDEGHNVASLLQRINPERVLLVHCFWSFGYSHLRSPIRPSSRTYWPVDDDLSEIRKAADSAQVVVICRTPETREKEQRLAAQGFDTLRQDNDYWVLKNRAAIR